MDPAIHPESGMMEAYLKLRGVFNLNIYSRNDIDRQAKCINVAKKVATECITSDWVEILPELGGWLDGWLIDINSNVKERILLLVGPFYVLGFGSLQWYFANRMLQFS